MTLVLEPLADAELILGSTEKLRLLLGVNATLYHRHGSVIEVYKASGNDLHRKEPKELCPGGLKLRLVYVHRKYSQPTVKPELMNWRQQSA